MVRLRRSLIDLLLVATVFAVDILIQSYNLGKAAYTFTDAGVYLYSAELVSKGFMPYRDFFLGHPPFLIYVTSAVLKVTNANLDLFHFLYIIWVFSSIIPIYCITLSSYSNRTAALLSILLFSATATVVDVDSHSFALRQASLPLLAYSLYFVLAKPKQRIAALLLSLFAISIVSNLLIAACLVAFLLAGDVLYVTKDPGRTIRNYKPFILTFVVAVALGYVVILLIPNGFSNVFGVHLNRPYVPYDLRLQWSMPNLSHDWPIVLFGVLGSVFVDQRVKLFGPFNLVSFLILFSVGPSYYPHYLVPLAVGFSISAGVFMSYLAKSPSARVMVGLFVIFAIYTSSYQYLKHDLIIRKTPEFFELVKELGGTSETLFAFEPLYALYAGKELTFHYYVANMRYFRVLNQNLSEREYLDLLRRSKTVLIEPFALSLLPASTLTHIRQNFLLKYDRPPHRIYVRKPANISPPEPRP